jgi:tetratricopeptide (TPR) repeat protein
MSQFPNPQVKINSSALNSYLYLGEYDKFLQSLSVNDNVYILFYRGLSEYHQNNHEQAARDFDRAFERDPSLLPADVGKALSYSIRHDNSRGLTLLRQTESKIEERGVSDAEGIYKLAQAVACWVTRLPPYTCCVTVLGVDSFVIPTSCAILYYRAFATNQNSKR